MGKLAEKVLRDMGIEARKSKSKPLVYGPTAGPKTEMEVLALIVDVFGEGVQLVDMKKGIEAKEYNGDSCLKCRACGNWPDHEGGPFCFYRAVYLGKSCIPKPINQAREKCGRITSNTGRK